MRQNKQCIVFTAVEWFACNGKLLLFCSLWPSCGRRLATTQGCRAGEVLAKREARRTTTCFLADLIRRPEAWLSNQGLSGAIKS